LIPHLTGIRQHAIVIKILVSSWARFSADQGRDALEKYTQTKSVWVNL